MQEEGFARQERGTRREQTLRVTQSEDAPFAPVRNERAALLKELARINDAIALATRTPKRRAQLRAERAALEERFAAIAETLPPVAAYHEARTALAAQRDEHAAQTEKAWSTADDDAAHTQMFWLQQVYNHGERLAEEQVAADMLSYDLDVYHHGLEAQYAKYAANETTQEPGSDAELDFTLLQQKITAFTKRMDDARIARRLTTERERRVLAKALARTTEQLQHATSARAKLNLLNPRHWSQIWMLGKEITRLGHDREDAAMRSKLLAGTPIASELSSTLKNKTLTVLPDSAITSLNNEAAPMSATALSDDAIAPLDEQLQNVA